MRGLINTLNYSIRPLGVVVLVILLEQPLMYLKIEPSMSKVTPLNDQAYMNGWQIGKDSPNELIESQSQVHNLELQTNEKFWKI